MTYIMGGPLDATILTIEGSRRLQLLRERHIHRTKDDLVAHGRQLAERLEADSECTEELATRNFDEDQRYLKARKASFDALTSAYRSAIRGSAKNLKPFSQRLIKGLLVSKVTGSRVHIGSLTDALADGLVRFYGETFVFMQDAEVVATAPDSPELSLHTESFKASGNFLLCHPANVPLANPRIVLNADLVLLDPRTIYHEIQHARQHLACEGSIHDFKESKRYETSNLECQAKQAEADLINIFGILY